MIRLSDNQRRFTCCFCLHVRTGTILLGIGQIILHLICISILILSALRPDVLPSAVSHLEKGNPFDVTDRNNGHSHVLSIFLHLVPGISDLQDSLTAAPNHQSSGKTKEDGSSNESSLTGIDDNNTENEKELTPLVKPNGFVLDNSGSTPNKDSSVGIRHRRPFSPYFALCLSTFSLAFCCFLVHGAIARQPTHLLPFFFLQVFDFIISLLTVVGYMSSTSDVRFWLHMKNGSMYINSTSLTFLLLSVSCLFLAFKAYCLGMVWDCYKYLMLTYHRSDQNADWSGDPFAFFPSIWGFLGSRRRSSLFRGNAARVASDHPLFGSAGDGDGQGNHHRPPATYDQSNDLPNYEDALKIPANAYAPPPYFVPGEANKTATQTPPSSNANTDTNTNTTNSNGNNNNNVARDNRDQPV